MKRRVWIGIVSTASIGSLMGLWLLAISTDAVDSKRKLESRESARHSEPKASTAEPDSNDMRAVRAELAHVRAQLRQLHESVAARDPGSTEAPAETIDPHEEESQSEGEDVRTQTARQEDDFRRALDATTIDKAWNAEVTEAFDAALARLPGASLDSMECGGTVCISEIRHDVSSSASDLWGAIGSDPVFAGQVLLVSRKEDGPGRTAVYVKQAGSEPIPWNE